MFVAVVFLTVIAGVLLAGILDRRAMNARRRRLSARRGLDHEQWFRTLYAPLGIDQALVTGVLSRLAGRLRCDVTQLYPTDAFDDELELRRAARVHSKRVRRAITAHTLPIAPGRPEDRRSRSIRFDPDPSLRPVRPSAREG